jgi:hypothetical protein
MNVFRNLVKLNDKRHHVRLSDGEEKSEALANKHLLLLKQVKDQLEENNKLTQSCKCGLS